MRKDMPVSFIIPALNAGGVIERCLESICGQDYPADNVEMIVVDNGSQDNTVAIAKRFTPHIIIDANATIAQLRNLGARNAKGDYFVFMDSDCVIPKDWLRIALSYCDDNGTSLVGSKHYLLPETAGWIDETWNIHLQRARGKKEIGHIGAIIMLVKKAVFAKLGGFDESLSTCEDVDFCYRVKKIGRIVSDDRLAPIHLGVRISLRDFFKKESWRAQDNMCVTMRYIRTWPELLGFAWLFYYVSLSVALVPAVIIALFARDIRCILVVSAGLVLPITILSFDTCRMSGKFAFFGKLFLLYFVYTAARMIAILPCARR